MAGDRWCEEMGSSGDQKITDDGADELWLEAKRAPEQPKVSITTTKSKNKLPVTLDRSQPPNPPIST
uniref:Uncharacterized protein n=1 Tax=Panagrellus redivivus TaxID=6233 RepID=A0A7E4VF58_PANRE